MIYILSILLNTLIQLNIYWEDIPYNKQNDILNSGKINEYVLNYYQKEFILTDNENTNILLAILSSLSNDDGIRALYFYSFNEVISFLDGALSEILGNYLQKMILSDPDYVISYLKRHKKLCDMYIHHLGVEFYFNQEKVSDSKYDLNEFKEIIKSKLGEKNEYEDFLILFYNPIKQVMTEME